MTPRRKGGGEDSSTPHGVVVVVIQSFRADEITTNRLMGCPPIVRRRQAAHPIDAVVVEDDIQPGPIYGGQQQAAHGLDVAIDVQHRQTEEQNPHCRP